MVKCFRQGDVLLVEVARGPSDARPVQREAGRLVLAHGEVTGHAHVIAAAAAELVTPEQADELYLLVYGDDIVLEHEEHDAIPLPPGHYRVIRQREYTPESVRFVAD
jgi:hypothetical protein